MEAITKPDQILLIREIGKKWPKHDIEHITMLLANKQILNISIVLSNLNTKKVLYAIRCISCRDVRLTRGTILINDPANKVVIDMKCMQVNV